MIVLVGGGSVAIYLRPYIPFTIGHRRIQLLPYTIEYILVELPVSHSKMLLCAFYSPCLRIDYFSFEYFTDKVMPIPKLMMLTTPTSVLKRGQCAVDAFSYHDLIYLPYKLRPLKAKSRILLLRSFRKMKLDRLREDAQSIKWSAVTEISSIIDKIEVFNSLITRLYDTCS
ncbi:unnamed protein product [Euphydryas editha]|uniref:Uncharacterized protein n=1 Tax=Euphydryas editha TaxID=104508 RepID=A0AAU9UUA0_EUPED|nr:unnamed protein product [Euphydryas editha]